MPRPINLRQIEALKALIENGTVSRAAEVMNVSQPSMSKLIAYLEADADVKLFDRIKGRLAPTEQAMRLYEEIGRIFSGVRQVENALDAIRREQQGNIAVASMSSMSGPFIARATASFLRNHPDVFCAVYTLHSPWIVDGIISRKLDIGVVNSNIESPYVKLEPLERHGLVLVMPPGHHLEAKDVIQPNDLDEERFITYNLDTYLGSIITKALDTYKVRPKSMLILNSAPNVFEFVALGLGVALVHPLTLGGFEHKVSIRKFEPDIWYKFQLCRGSDVKNSHLIDHYMDAVRKTAASTIQTISSKMSTAKYLIPNLYWPAIFNVL